MLIGSTLWQASEYIYMQALYPSSLKKNNNNSIHSWKKLNLHACVCPINYYVIKSLW